MEENKQKLNPMPGLAEAIHPEIGNGVAWENAIHEMLLRSPDPAKQLDHLLSIEDLRPIDVVFPEALENAPSPSVTGEIASSGQSLENMVNTSASSEHLEENTVPEAVKGKKKGKSKKERKGEREEDQKQIKAASDDEKSPKAGKLVRKAAKSIKRQEKEQNQALEERTALPEMELSPYTRWLKSFPGSDYVHPYEDDFAFNQGAGPTREGISETFADLLASQGYKDQAVEMYIKLKEKYPEKSAFFATKIEALQQ